MIIKVVKMSIKNLLTIILLTAFFTVHAQSYRIADGSTMQIQGTSNLHDWTTDATQLKGSAVFRMDDESSIQIESAIVTIPVHSIMSEKGKKMDKLTYEALNADVHKEIRFELLNARYVEAEHLADIEGLLTVNGVTKMVAFESTLVDENPMTWTGSVDMKMTDFEVDPPKALLGTLRTRDDIKIEFELKFVK